ncbi:hypothetical protein KIS4809_4376 [Bacillus sp. ZZV12-4809]|nr:hypothetical protein KIS4809_4376 [Bacillus sp. ZZV12-4809]
MPVPISTNISFKFIIENVIKHKLKQQLVHINLLFPLWLKKIDIPAK